LGDHVAGVDAKQRPTLHRPGTAQQTAPCWRAPRRGGSGSCAARHMAGDVGRAAIGEEVEHIATGAAVEVALDSTGPSRVTTGCRPRREVSRDGQKAAA